MAQDNKSEILLKQNGIFKISKMKKINIIYYFIRDRIEKGELEVEYHSTDKRWQIFYKTTEED